MIDPLCLAFDVECGIEQAFELWTERASMWWPRTHTTSRSRATRVVFEPTMGGRIFERRPDGGEVDWGSIVTWAPPYRLVYKWHVFSESVDATEVEVQFRDNGNGTTKVDIEHRGWEAFADGELRRSRNETGWTGLVESYRAACAG
jgi:uncharacterized protein YndB with AHSA1/START domain